MGSGFNIHLFNEYRNGLSKDKNYPAVNQVMRISDFKQFNGNTIVMLEIITKVVLMRM